MVRWQISAEMMRLMCLCACVRCSMPGAIIPGGGGGGGGGDCPDTHMNMSLKRIILLPWEL